MSSEDTFQLVSNELQELEFVLSHLAPLLGSHYLHPPVPVRISQELLQKIGISIEDSRPEARKMSNQTKKNGIDISIPYGFLQRDHSLFAHETHDGHVLCVEIKPKCGFLPSSPICSDVKRRYCRYCMHQRLKLNHGEIRCASEYCPIDLFSGSSPRMDRALNSLFDEPQNNIKVFCNGRLSFTGNIAPSSIDSVASRTGQAAPPPLLEEEASRLKQERLSLLDGDLSSIGFPFASKGGEVEKDEGAGGWEALKRLVLEVLESNNILNRILEVQKLDDLDVEIVFRIYEKLLSQIALQHTLAKNLVPSLDDTFDVFTSLDDFSGEERDWIVTKQLQTMTIRRALEHINNYSLAATAKDCSIMITLYPINEAPPVIVSSSDSHGVIANGKWGYRVAIIDTDKKQPNHIPHYHHLDKKIINNFTDLLNHDQSLSSLVPCSLRKNIPMNDL
eukprot:TRINITY_DN7088_c0_g1_i1.p1 TRINITY_DN7088_c0_g1~~TRINITY_DN7088_c0_g1_i1.p1  ORF type:complete len:500 (-),score=106.67 TRINITY_DN7088_c0_g1_i1:11-1354(-)